MKNKQLLCVLFPLLVACTGQRHQQQVSSESIIEEAVRKGEVLKGEIVPIDTALFRYAYRMRVQGDKAVILDLHNADYYYHVFTYPDFQYQSSFGKRGEGPGESIYAANIRFAGQDTVWVLDDGKGRMYQYSGIAGGKTPKQEKDILLDEAEFKALGNRKILFNTGLSPAWDESSFTRWLEEDNLCFCDTLGALGSTALLTHPHVRCMQVSTGRTRQAFDRLSEKVLANLSEYNG